MIQPAAIQSQVQAAIEINKRADHMLISWGVYLKLVHFSWVAFSSNTFPSFFRGNFPIYFLASHFFLENMINCKVLWILLPEFQAPNVINPTQPHRSRSTSKTHTYIGGGSTTGHSGTLQYSQRTEELVV